MSWSIVLDGDGYRFQSEGEYSILHPFALAQSPLTPGQAPGDWLVLNIAVWSVQDQKCVETLLKFGQSTLSKFRLGVRPYDEFEQIRAWCPDVSEEYGSPFWLLLRDAVLLDQRVGTLTPTDLSSWATQPLT